MNKIKVYEELEVKNMNSLVLLLKVILSLLTRKTNKNASVDLRLMVKLNLLQQMNQYLRPMTYRDMQLEPRRKGDQSKKAIVVVKVSIMSSCMHYVLMHE